MKIVELLRIVRRHIVLLVLFPGILAVLVTYLTRKPNYKYTSQTVLFTGLATGSSIEMNKSFNYFVTNTAFDNLINIVSSRETQQEVAIRLLSQHLMMEQADPKYISKSSFDGLKKMVPSYLYNYVVKQKTAPDSITKAAAASNHFGANELLFPSYINRDDYNETLRNLRNLMKGSDTNFIYKLLNFEHPHYSIKAISGVKAVRIANSDLIKLTFESDDPGICQQTLSILNGVLIENYKFIKENRSDDVIRYFENQLKDANAELKKAEQKMLEFNKENNIINYYEQSKAVAVAKEDMELDYNNKKAMLAGYEATIKKLEDKLNIQELIQTRSAELLEKKRKLGDLNYQIAVLEGDTTSTQARNRSELEQKAEQLKSDIRTSVDALYTYNNSVEGLPVSKTLNEWISNVIEAENLKAKLKVMDNNNRDFRQQYSIYAPAGANIKKIEREIFVSEQGYLEILHGLNLAKLKLQDNELSSNLKAIDLPYYPISPVPTNRKVLIIAAGLVGFIVLLGLILVMEYFDDTLRNQRKATKTTSLQTLGMIPKIYRNAGIQNFERTLNRCFELLIQNLHQQINLSHPTSHPKVVTILSMQEAEGKSILAGNLIHKFEEQGNKCVYINFSDVIEQKKYPGNSYLFRRLMGYPDPRIDYNSPALASPEQALAPGRFYQCDRNQAFYNAKDYKQLIAAFGISIPADVDYLFIEFPALLSNNYPEMILGSADINLLLARSNRVWSEADRNMQEKISAFSSGKLFLVLNGVEIQELESVLGELQKKRSLFRKKIKNIVQMQFFSKNKL